MFKKLSSLWPEIICYYNTCIATVASSLLWRVMSNSGCHRHKTLAESDDKATKKIRNNLQSVPRPSFCLLDRRTSQVQIPSFRLCSTCLNKCCSTDYAPATKNSNIQLHSHINKHFPELLQQNDCYLSQQQIFRLHKMHEMQTIVTNVPMACCVCQPVCLPVTCLTACTLQNGQMDRAPICGKDFWETKEYCIQRQSHSPAQIQCSLREITLDTCFKSRTLSC